MRQAVSVIFTCGEEIFYVRRQNHLSVFPGYTAFPGGKVDKEDDRKSPEALSSLAQELGNALIRETQEELGYDLVAGIDTGEIESFHEIGTAITPSFNPYRFITHFYRVTLKEKKEFLVDEGEAAYAGWLSPKELLGKFEKGELMAVPPTIKMIKALSENIHLQETLDLSLEYDEDSEVPMIESICGLKQFLPLSNTFPPAKRTNCFLLGDKKSFLVDPSPANEEEYKKLKKSVEKYKIDALFISHHHPDHHEFSPILARDLGVDLYMSLKTQERIESKWGQGYFDGLKIQHLKEGDILTYSLGHEVRVIEVPGHDDGQLALADKNGSWVFVGDLIQSIGTVVIGGDEGDMALYFESLERMIALKPRFIVPSHGIALGGVNKLEMTLKHRQLREEQIKELLNDGKSQNEILDIVYEGLAQELKRYAMKTIEAHIAKIQAEA